MAHTKPNQVAALKASHAAPALLLGVMAVAACAVLLAEAALASAEAVSLSDAMPALIKSDRYRGGLTEGAQWKVTLNSRGRRGEVSASYVVKAKGTSALVECVAPARKRNELTLFKEYALWFYKPGLRRPISLSARQRLIGEAANGDIAATNYARDYEIISANTVDLEGEAAWLLDLKAKAKQVTYDGVRYWIRKRDALGVKAEFLTVQGEVFKRATFEYENQISMNGKKYPFVSKMNIVSASFSNDVTTLTYDSPSVEKLSDSVFNVNHFLR